MSPFSSFGFFLVFIVGLVRGEAEGKADDGSVATVAPPDARLSAWGDFRE